MKPSDFYNRKSGVNDAFSHDFLVEDKHDSFGTSLVVTGAMSQVATVERIADVLAFMTGIEEQSLTNVLPGFLAQFEQ